MFKKITLLSFVLLTFLAMTRKGYTQGYCEPTYAYEGCAFGSSIEDFILAGENDTILEDLNTGCFSGYDFRSAVGAVELMPGEAYSATVISRNSDAHAAIWIDFEDNDSFELVGASEGALSYYDINWADEEELIEGAVVPLVIPQTAPAGEYRMRVFVSYGDPLSFDPCNEGAEVKQFGEMHDYQVTIAPAASCQKPTAVTISEIEADSADVTWQEGDAETSWQVRYGKLETWDIDDEATYTEIFVESSTLVSLTDLESATLYAVAVRAVCGPEDKSTWTSLTSFETDVWCYAPTHMLAEEITDDTGLLSWEAGAEESSWKLRYKKANLEESETTYVEQEVEGTSSLLLTDLAYYTEYEAQVRAVCAADKESSWSESFYFTTLPEGGYCVPPYEVSCGETSSYNHQINKVYLAGESTVLENATGCSTTNFGDYTDLAPADLFVGNSYTLSISTNNATPFNEGIKAWIDYDNDGEFTEEETIAISGDEGLTGGTQSYEFTLPEDLEAGELRMRIRLTFHPNEGSPELDACQSDYYGETEDYRIVVIDEYPCVGPSELVVSDLGETTAVVSWESQEKAEYWEVAYGEAGFELNEEGPFLIREEPQVSLEDLQENTDYEVYLRTTCDTITGERSDWTPALQFTTEKALCEAPMSISLSEPTKNSVTVFWDAVDDQNEWEVRYGEQGFDVEEEGHSIFNNYPFLNIGNLESGTPYEVYVRAICREDKFSEWVGGVSFITEEFVCEAPKTIALVELTAQSAMLAWQAKTGQDNWEVRYGEQGFDLEEEGTTLFTQEALVAIENLTPNTVYQAYVRTLCGQEKGSEWTISSTFTTGHLSVETPEFDKFMFFPNPVENHLTVRANQVIEKIIVYDLLGKNIYFKAGKNAEEQVDLSALEAGVYILKVQIEGTQNSYKLLKR